MKNDKRISKKFGEKCQSGYDPNMVRYSGRRHYVSRKTFSFNKLNSKTKWKKKISPQSQFKTSKQNYF